ncbi:MAG: type III secretion protein [Candidatus Dadabacteria bacterium]|nr:MAG: type III secretion protein [Candidatus Dadabacteria bacterium]
MQRAFSIFRRSCWECGFTWKDTVVTQYATANGFLPAFFMGLGYFSIFPFGFSLVSILLRVFFSAILGFSIASSVSCAGSSPVWSFVYGFLVALPAALFVSIASSWGALADIGRGQTIASVYNPDFHSPSSQMADAIKRLGIALVLLSGAMVEGVGALYRGGGLALKGDPFVVSVEMMGAIGRYLSSLFDIYLPLGACFIVVEVGAAFLGKAIPKISLYGESFSIKSIVLYGILTAISFTDFLPAVKTVSYVPFKPLLSSYGFVVEGVDKKHNGADKGEKSSLPGASSLNVASQR